MFSKVLFCRLMSPLRVKQSDPARVNMKQLCVPSSWRWRSTHTHFLHWGQNRAREEGLYAALRASCRSLRAGSFLSLTPPFSTGLITPWDSRLGLQANHHCPLWPALMWRPLPSAGVNSNQVLSLSFCCLNCMYSGVALVYWGKVNSSFSFTLVNLNWCWQHLGGMVVVT